MQAWFYRQWQSYGLAHVLLIPISWLYALVTYLRRALYRYRLLQTHRLPVPVVVVGNIHIGGTGKTPLVIYLVNAFKQAGYHPGVISRGYGGNGQGEVTLSSHPAQCGDEPLVIVRQTHCPVWINPDRVAAGRALLALHPECDVLISDDGLQHDRLYRDIELVVMDSQSPYLNRLLPAGPLREPLSRLHTVDALIDTAPPPSDHKLNRLSTLKNPVQCYAMQLRVSQLLSLDDQQTITPEALQRQHVVALAGIGNPQKFFNTVQQLGIRAEQRIFDDHHHYRQQDFADLHGKTLLMTEKDAVKCQHLALSNAWYVAVTAEVVPNPTAGTAQPLATFIQQRIQALKEKT